MSIAIRRTLGYAAKGKQEERLRLPHVLFLLFMVLKPFYFGASGSLQIADLVFVLSFIAWVFMRRGEQVIEAKHWLFLAFLVLVSAINAVHFILRPDAYFFMSSFYYLYNFLVILVISDLKNNQRFLKSLLWVLVFNLFVQLAILALGIGRFFWGIYRFMGTFNDPNQFAFSMFSTFLLIYVLSSYFKNRVNHRKKALVLLSFLLTVYFIFQGSSTGMLMGIAVFSGLMVLSFIGSERTPMFTFLKILSIVGIIAVVLIVLIFGNLAQQVDGAVGSDTFLIFRLVEKAQKITSGGLQAIFDERGLDKLALFPWYNIFGAGEGGFDRFPTSPFEVHSTLPGILFSYGLIPLLLLAWWIYSNLKEMNRVLIPAYLALLFESFFLAHQRQPAFWILIVLASLPYTQEHGPRVYRLTRRLR